MSFRKSWSGERGVNNVITKQNSTLKMLEIDMVSLNEGDSAVFAEKDTEFAVIVLDGTVTVSGDEIDYTLTREDIFSGPADCAFVPRNRAFTIFSKGGARAAVCKSAAEKDFLPKLIKATDVKTKSLGKGRYVRDASFLFADNVDCSLFYIGEFCVEDGNWASYPPHKHDEQNMPTEGKLEEVYYFEFDKPSGFGVQMVYDNDGKFNKAYRVESGDFVEIPKGYHPFVCAPGYKCYCLWIMAGSDRGIFSTTEKKHEWMNK